MTQTISELIENLGEDAIKDRFRDVTTEVLGQHYRKVFEGYLDDHFGESSEERRHGLNRMSQLTGLSVANLKSKYLTGDTVMQPDYEKLSRLWLIPENCCLRELSVDEFGDLTNDVNEQFTQQGARACQQLAKEQLIDPVRMHWRREIIKGLLTELCHDCDEPFPLPKSESELMLVDHISAQLTDPRLVHSICHDSSEHWRESLTAIIILLVEDRTNPSTFQLVQWSAFWIGLEEKHRTKGWLRTRFIEIPPRKMTGENINRSSDRTRKERSKAAPSESGIPAFLSKTLSDSSESERRKGCSLPLVPGFFTPEELVGRETDLSNIKEEMKIDTDPEKVTDCQIITAIQGMPGIGKSALAWQLSRDDDIQRVFPDGVLWMELGWHDQQNPGTLRETLWKALSHCSSLLNADDVRDRSQIADAARHIGQLLEERQHLLVLDDVWDSQQVSIFQDNLPKQCSLLVTTPLPKVLPVSADRRSSSYLLPELSVKASRELFTQHAPNAMKQYEKECQRLIQWTGRLPAMVIAAAKYIESWIAYGFSMQEALQQIREGTVFLQETIPRIRQDYGYAPVSVISLLNQMTNWLSEEARTCFYQLPWLKKRSVTVTKEQLVELWNVETSAEMILKELLDVGLIRQADDNKYRINHVIYLHAKFGGECF